MSVHLVPADQAHRRIIDGDNVCAAIEALDDAGEVAVWTQRFSLLGDPTRLRLLIAITAAGPISVSDLAVATGLTDDHVSQTLRFLRASNTVTARRDGRINRYELADRNIAQLLRHATNPRPATAGETTPPLMPMPPGPGSATSWSQ